jgi:hypothetical protein
MLRPAQPVAVADRRQPEVVMRQYRIWRAADDRNGRDRAEAGDADAGAQARTQTRPRSPGWSRAAAACSRAAQLATSPPPALWAVAAYNNRRSRAARRRSSGGLSWRRAPRSPNQTKKWRNRILIPGDPPKAVRCRPKTSRSRGKISVLVRRPSAGLVFDEAPLVGQPLGFGGEPVARIVLSCTPTICYNARLYIGVDVHINRGRA